MTYVVIVTYGSRRTYLERVLNFFSPLDSIQIIVVNNNSDYSVAELILSLNRPEIFCINSKENKGSAWGYKTGIQHASEQENCDLIWLLDDDNLPETNSLEILQSKFELLKSEKENNNFALMAYRVDRKYISNVVRGEPVKWNFPQSDAFLGFHLFKLHYLISKKLKLFKRTSLKNNINIPCAPYGGFFFHKDLIQMIGLPDERFFVYADDFDFTYRIQELGGVIYLIEDCKVHDLEQTWQISKQKRMFSPNILNVESNKVYLSTRNFIYFQNQHLVHNRFIFNLNRIIYSNYLYLLAILKGKRANFRRFLEATNDGLNGNFNNNKYPI